MTENQALDDVLEAKRKKAKKRQDKLFKSRMRLFGFILLVILLIFFYFFTTLSNIKEVKVKGNNYISKNEIVEISNYQVGDKFFLSYKNLFSDKLKQSPFIQSSRVNHIFPNKIELDVEEVKLVGYVYSGSDIAVYTGSGNRIILDSDHLGLIAHIPMYLGFVEDNVLNNDYSVVIDLNGFRLDLLANVPLITGNVNNQIVKLADGLKDVDASVLDSLSEIHPYETSYDTNMYHVITREGKHIFLEYESLDKLNNLLTIETHLSANDECLFFVSDLNSAYTKTCPWDEIVEPDVTENPDESSDITITDDTSTQIEVQKDDNSSNTTN